MMNLKKKMRTASQIARMDGLYGVTRHIWKKLTCHSERGQKRYLRRISLVLDRYFCIQREAEEVFEEDIFGTIPIFRYATCDDLIQLMARYPQYCFADRDSDKSYVWGLKAVGTLFCMDKIVRFRPKRVLEVGAGWSLHFDKHFGGELDYWMIDDASDIVGWEQSREKFEEFLDKRQNTHFVRGLLGHFLPELPDEYFDIVFSVSVLEHVPPEQKSDVYKDMFRVLKPGGIIAHSIDNIAHKRDGRRELRLISDAGFVMPKRPSLRVRVMPYEGKPTLFEDLWSVFHSYMGLYRTDKWEKLKSIPYHYPTVLVFGFKPSDQ